MSRKKERNVHTAVNQIQRMIQFNARNWASIKSRTRTQERGIDICVNDNNIRIK